MYDPIAEGLTRGWRHIDASTLTTDQQFDTDVAIIGTGAGGGIAAELLTQAGTDKNRILNAMLWLDDLRDFDEVNQVWDAWIDTAHAPARSTGQVRMTRPGMLVEIIVTAAA